MSLSLEKIYLVDLDPALIKAWDENLGDLEVFETVLGDFFEIPADCMVSPANSFGYMDGGLDAAITYELGGTIQDHVQDSILANYYGELPVGCAVIVVTNDSRWPLLASVPTMRVPEDVSKSVNAYLAFRALLLEILKYNKINQDKPIKSVICPGLATGIGNLPPKNCAVQMREAYDQCMSEARILSFGEIHTGQLKMRSD
jgi:O-acetyl-ADP-ribose deacetylase (regulator of RNase III)